MSSASFISTAYSAGRIICSARRSSWPPFASQRETRSLKNRMPRMSSTSSPTTGMREKPERTNRRRAEGAGVSASMVTMSVRGTMTSRTSVCPRSRTDRTMSRSSSSKLSGSPTSSTISRRSEISSARACASVGSGAGREERTRVSSGSATWLRRARRSASPVPTNAIPSGLRAPHWAGRKETKISWITAMTDTAMRATAHQGRRVSTRTMVPVTA